MVQQTLKPPLCPAAGPTDLIRELEEVQSMQVIPFVARNELAPPKVCPIGGLNLVSQRAI